MDTVAVLGTGLIGTSFALALKSAGFRGRIIGVSSPASVRAAVERGAVDEPAELAVAVRQADLVYLAQPIQKILDLIPEVARHARPDALVTDAGSTKRRIVECAGRRLGESQFLGGHPMAGKESRGAAAADADLFRDRPYFLTPARPEMIDEPRIAGFMDWLVRTGAKPAVLSAGEHDRLVAATSHLPQMISTALASLLARQPDAALLAESGGPGLADMTRLALSSHDIWADILATNGDEISRLLEMAEIRLREIRTSLDDAKPAFDEAYSFAERVPRRTV